MSIILITRLTDGTAQSEAQLSAQQDAANRAPDASQVGSEQAAHDDAHTPPREITQEQLRAQLNAYYAYGHVMNPAAALACGQLVPVTALVITYMAIAKMNATIHPSLYDQHLHRSAVQFLPGCAVGACGAHRKRGAGGGGRGQF
jgi:hypothetical protein